MFWNLSIDQRAENGCEWASKVIQSIENKNEREIFNNLYYLFNNHCLSSFYSNNIDFFINQYLKKNIRYNSNNDFYFLNEAKYQIIELVKAQVDYMPKEKFRLNIFLKLAEEELTRCLYQNIECKFDETYLKKLDKFKQEILISIQSKELNLSESNELQLLQEIRKLKNQIEVLNKKVKNYKNQSEENLNLKSQINILTDDKINISKNLNGENSKLKKENSKLKNKVNLLEESKIKEKEYLTQENLSLKNHIENLKNTILTLEYSNQKENKKNLEKFEIHIKKINNENIRLKQENLILKNQKNFNLENNLLKTKLSIKENELKEKLQEIYKLNENNNKLKKRVQELKNKESLIKL